MRITTWNVNGLRAALRKDFRKHLEVIAPDLLLLQEVRANPEQLPDEIARPQDWQVIWNAAQKPGYSGTAVWSRQAISPVSRGLSRGDTDSEGRVIEVTTGPLALACIYLPSGSSGPHRQREKDAFLKRMTRWAQRRTKGRPMILAGDFNVAPTAADLFYAKGNEGNSGFLPHERKWFHGLLNQGWHDVIREIHGPVQGPYTWWSNRGRARELDRGWRIDHVLCNSAARPLITNAIVHRDAGLDTSDHAPVSVDLDLSRCN